MTGRRKERTWPPYAFTALEVPCPAVDVLNGPKQPSRGPWACHWCRLTFTRWAPCERHATVCELRPHLHAGWIEVVL